MIEAETGVLHKKRNYTPYKELAAAIIYSAVKEHDVQFFKREWCKELCDISDINYDALCEKVGIKK